MFCRGHETGVSNIISKMAAEQLVDNQKFTGIRLPTNVQPIHYDLHLQPDLKRFVFDGTVVIEYKSDDASCRQIVLHSNELTIHRGFAQSSDRKESISQVSSVTYSKDSETVTLDFADKVPQWGRLSLYFSGSLNDKMKGFYRTAYKNSAGENIYAATTQFEATDARRCFPCWDEPAIKATFSVTMIQNTASRPDNKPMVVLSNMPVAETSAIETTHTTVFEKCPKMSTYLLAFCVGDFEFIEGTDGKRPIRVYTTPGKKEQGRFALEVACKSLAYYEDYFKIGYPLPKMDLIAIPDFASGAMENWGLVTYRETCLLVDPKNTSTVAKQYIAIIVAHELAHQWFGNLVTMEWWTHLWLNEGFASFMEFLCVDHIFPEYDIWSQFITDSFSRALDLDSLDNSHPIEVTVGRSSEVDEIFDDISYNKGASVIRMLYNYIGDDSFREGMKQYLTKFAYKNATTEDLWESLEEISNKPVGKLMSGWTSQKGFPWLSVSCSTGEDVAKLSITQSKFTASGKIPAEEADVQWLIPIATLTGSDPRKPGETSLFEGKSGVIEVEGAGDNWIKLNPGTVSLFRTAYSDDMAQKLWAAIKDQSLPPMDRLNIQNDLHALCQAGKVRTVELLKFLKAFKGETNYTVWSSIDSCVGRLNLLLSNTDYQPKFHVFVRDLYADIFKKLTWFPQENEKHTDAMTRTLVINRLVSSDHDDVIEEAKRRYRAQIDNSEMIMADLRGACYRAVAMYGDDECFDYLYVIYKSAVLHEEKNRAARALGSAIDPVRLERVVDFLLSDEVRKQDKVFVIAPIGVLNPPVAWKLLKENKDSFRDMYESGFLMSRLIKCCTESFVTEEMAQEVSKFFQENKFPGAERTIQQSLETIRLSAGWLERDNEEIKVYLSS